MLRTLTWLGGFAGACAAGAPTVPAPAPPPAEAPTRPTSKVPSTGELPGLIGAAPRAPTAEAPRPAGIGTVTLRSVEVRAGRRTVEQVRAPLEGAREALRVCLAEAIVAAPGLHGDLQVNLVVAADGRVNTVGADPGPVHGALAACAGRAVQETRYPAAAEITIARAVFTFAP